MAFSIFDMTLAEATDQFEELQFELAKSAVAAGITEDARATEAAKAFQEEFLCGDRQKRAIQDLFGVGEGVTNDQKCGDPEAA